MIRPSDWALLGLSATACATSFGVPAAPASAPLRETAELFPGWAARPQQALRLGLGCSLHLGRAGQLLAGFRADFADVDLSLADIDAVRAHEGLRRDGMDAAILIAEEAPAGLRSAGLWREPLMAVLPAGHPLAASAAPVDPAALRHEIMLMAGDAHGDAGLQRAVVRAFGGPPVGFLRYHVERDTLFDLVALGFGIALAPGRPRDAPRAGVHFRPIAGDADAPCRLLWNPGNCNPALQAFVRAARLFRHGAAQGFGSSTE
jgi:DNA-binding transcriptional LysR family regulator